MKLGLQVIGECGSSEDLQLLREVGGTPQDLAQHAGKMGARSKSVCFFFFLKSIITVKLILLLCMATKTTVYGKQKFN